MFLFSWIWKNQENKTSLLGESQRHVEKNQIKSNKTVPGLKFPGFLSRLTGEKRGGAGILWNTSLTSTGHGGIHLLHMQPEHQRAPSGSSGGYQSVRQWVSTYRACPVDDRCPMEPSGSRWGHGEADWLQDVTSEKVNPTSSPWGRFCLWVAVSCSGYRL